MLAIIVLLLFFALTSPKSAFSRVGSKTWETGGLLAFRSAVIYASFQVAGVVGSVASVVKGLESKAESRKAALFGFFTNAILIILIAFRQFGYPQFAKAEMPNYEILKLLNVPVLYWIYVVLIELAVISSVIGLNNGWS